ncbi:MAG: DUF4317 domain-containing protein [Oscillospiraceae bacterium]|nr:DUF4317 domain-containing protein [Oscillospiraceae bacterium]
MNQKDLREIRRRVRPDHNSVRTIYGCFVNGGKQIIADFEESVGLLSEEESEKYFSLIRKTLSGSLGRTLRDISFASRQVMDSEEHQLLSALRRTELKDPELRRSFYDSVISSIDMGDENYAILMIYDAYDVPHRNEDEGEDSGGDVYRYLLACVCPVKTGKAELGYDAASQSFHTAALGQVLTAPTLGFLFPGFEERSTNLYGALFYSRDVNDPHDDFIDAVFKTPVPMPAGEQKEKFQEMISASLGEKNSFDVVQGIHEQLSERIVLYKESRDPEPMTMTADEMAEIMENSGASGRQIEHFRSSCREMFGEDGTFSPGNLTDPKKMVIETPEIKITVDPQYSHLIRTEVIDGRKFILIAADSGVEINGIGVDIE